MWASNNTRDILKQALGILNDKTSKPVTKIEDTKNIINQILESYYNGDTIYIEWNVDDIYRICKEHKIRKPSRNKAREILKDIEDDHDASLGISWDTLYEKVVYSLQK